MIQIVIRTAFSLAVFVGHLVRTAKVGGDDLVITEIMQLTTTICPVHRGPTPTRSAPTTVRPICEALREDVELVEEIDLLA